MRILTMVLVGRRGGTAYLLYWWRPKLKAKRTRGQRGGGRAAEAGKVREKPPIAERRTAARGQEGGGKGKGEVEDPKL